VAAGDELERDFGEKVRAARIAAGLSQKELAKPIRSSQESISRIENGRGPTLRTCARIAEALGMVIRLDLIRPKRDQGGGGNPIS
jgi:transcriptional regulator with XRE-family HTH domain